MTKAAHHPPGSAAGPARRAVLIPVKRFHRAKTRLASALSAAERRGLAAALCADLFEVVARTPGVGQVFVVSGEPRALAWARQRGWSVFVERRQVSEKASVNLATRYCIAAGCGTLLRLPIDLPLAQPEDLAAVFAAAGPAPAAVLVPSRDGTGTNALLRSPPDAFPTHFGAGSLRRHLAAARQGGVRARVLRLPRLAWDVDDWSDLQALASRARPGTAFAAWLLASGRLSGVLSVGGRPRPAIAVTPPTPAGASKDS